MRRSTLAVHVALLAVGLVACGSLVQAQYRTSIQGVVTDSSGAVVPGAKLTLTNPATGEKQTRVSSPDGVYNFNALAAARFRVEVEKEGFEKQVLDNVDLIPEQPNALNIQLNAGAISTTVNVDASAAPLLDTETASVNGVVTDNQIQHMPAFGRDVLKLSQLAPGSFGDQAQGSGGGTNNIPGTQTGASASGGTQGIFATENGAQTIANGNQTQNNGVTIDGISTASAVWGGSTVITPSEDSVESVKIVSNSYDAESGRFSGAQIQITSKSGTNHFHGSLFFTDHQPNLNAYQRFNGAGNTDLRDNSKFSQFGGSVGGPIWKNKVFFFFNYETVREPNTANQSNAWFETSALDSSAPAGSIASQFLSFPGNGVVNVGINAGASCTTAGLTEGPFCKTIPGQGLDIGSPLKTGLGMQDLSWVSPQQPGVGGGLDGVADIANYTISTPSTSSAAQYNGRLDADVTVKDHVGFAIYWVPQSSTFYYGDRGYDLFHKNQINNAFSGIYNHTFSPNLLNEFRVNAAGWRWDELSSNPQSPLGLPADSVGMVGTINLNAFGPMVGSIFKQWTYSYKDVATKILGRHTIKFGGEATRLFYLQDNVSSGIPSYNFFNIWDFLNDAPQSEQNTTFNPNTGVPTAPRQDDRENLLGFFVQDDFKLRPNLTINLGLRWSYFGPLYSKEDNMFVAHPGAGADYLNGLTVRKGDSWNAQKDNLGPEIGFAWSPARFNDKFVIRGGYGINYNQNQIAISSNIVNNPGLDIAPTFSISVPTSPNPGIVYKTSSDPHNPYGYPANPNAVLTLGPNGLPTTGQVNIQLFQNDMPTMYTHHYSLDTQLDVGHQFIFSLGYEGSLSKNIYFHQNPNATPAALGLTLNPQIGGGDYWGANGHGNYNTMLVEVKHQFSHQFMADAQYAWSRSMDTSSGPYFEQDYPYNPDLNYGRSDYNVTDAFKVYGVWQPVIFRGSKGWIDKIAGGWSLSGILNWHSGFPWTPVASVNGGSLYCGTCSYTELLPSAYLGGAGDSTSNDQFKTGANYSRGGTAYFATPTYTAYGGTDFGNTLPQPPGVRRNSLNGPGYKSVDMTISKGFGLPNNKVLGEGAKVELRLDAFNVFNNLNFNVNNNDISNNITAPNFGADTAALGARVVAIGARFSF